MRALLVIAWPFAGPGRRAPRAHRIHINYLDRRSRRSWKWCHLALLGSLSGMLAPSKFQLSAESSCKCKIIKDDLAKRPVGQLEAQDVPKLEKIYLLLRTRRPSQVLEGEGHVPIEEDRALAQGNVMGLLLLKRPARVVPEDGCSHGCAAPLWAVS